MLQNKHRSTSQVDRFGQVEEDGSANGMLMGILDAVDLRQIGNVLQKYDDLRSLKQVNVPDLSSSTPNSGVDAYQGEILGIDDRIDLLNPVPVDLVQKVGTGIKLEVDLPHLKVHRRPGPPVF